MGRNHRYHTYLEAKVKSYLKEDKMVLFSKIYIPKTNNHFFQKIRKTNEKHDTNIKSILNALT